MKDPEPDPGSGGAAAPPSGDDGERDELGLTDQQWAVVASAPVVVFLMVAAADGNIDEKEIEAFGSTLVGSLGGDSRVMVGAAARAAPNLKLMIEKLTRKSFDDLASLVAAARQIADQSAGRAEGRAFAQACYTLGETVANASGGGFLGFESKVGKEERAMLDGLKKLLQLA